MSKTVGFILILAGVGVASSLLAIGPDAEQDRRKPSSVERSTVTTVPAARPPAQAVRRLATAHPVHAATSRTAARRPAAARRRHAALSRRRRRLPAAKHKVAPMPRDRASLARELQLELRRVGCYGGDLNGVWTPATRKAMKAFTDRVNATLPVEAARRDPAHSGAGPSGRGLRQPCPPGPRARRRRTLPAGRDPGAGGQEGRAAHGADGTSGPASRPRSPHP